jgi:hypothetical protein
MVEFSPLIQFPFLLGLGFLYLMMGYRALRFWMKLESAILLMGLGILTCGRTEHWPVVLGIAALLAVLGWKLGNFYYYLHLVFVGSIVGALAGSTISSAGWVAVAGGVVGTVAAFLLQRSVLIAGTSAIGAFCLTMAALVPSVLMGGKMEFTWEAGLCWAVVTTLGIVHQVRTTKKPVERCDLTRPPAPSGP